MVLSVVGRVNSIVLKGKQNESEPGSNCSYRSACRPRPASFSLARLGYTETEIQRFLNENEMSPLIQVSMNEQMYANAIRGQALAHE